MLGRFVRPGGNAVVVTAALIAAILLKPVTASADGSTVCHDLQYDGTLVQGVIASDLIHGKKNYTLTVYFPLQGYNVTDTLQTDDKLRTKMVHMLMQPEAIPKVGMIQACVPTMLAGATFRSDADMNALHVVFSPCRLDIWMRRVFESNLLRESIDGSSDGSFSTWEPPVGDDKPFLAADVLEFSTSTSVLKGHVRSFDEHCRARPLGGSYPRHVFGAGVPAQIIDNMCSEFPVASLFPWHVAAPLRVTIFYDSISLHPNQTVIANAVLPPYGLSYMALLQRPLVTYSGVTISLFGSALDTIDHLRVVRMDAAIQASALHRDAICAYASTFTGPEAEWSSWNTTGFFRHTDITRADIEAVRRKYPPFSRVVNHPFQQANLVFTQPGFYVICAATITDPEIYTALPCASDILREPLTNKDAARWLSSDSVYHPDGSEGIRVSPERGIDDYGGLGFPAATTEPFDRPGKNNYGKWSTLSGMVWTPFDPSPTRPDGGDNPVSCGGVAFPLEDPEEPIQGFLSMPLLLNGPLHACNAPRPRLTKLPPVNQAQGVFQAYTIDVVLQTYPDVIIPPPAGEGFSLTLELPPYQSLRSTGDVVRYLSESLLQGAAGGSAQALRSCLEETLSAASFETVYDGLGTPTFSVEEFMRLADDATPAVNEWQPESEGDYRVHHPLCSPVDEEMASGLRGFLGELSREGVWLRDAGNFTASHIIRGFVSHRILQARRRSYLVHLPPGANVACAGGNHTSGGYSFPDFRASNLSGILGAHDTLLMSRDVYTAVAILASSGLRRPILVNRSNFLLRPDGGIEQEILYRLSERRTTLGTPFQGDSLPSPLRWRWGGEAASTQHTPAPAKGVPDSPAVAAWVARGRWGGEWAGRAKPTVFASDTIGGYLARQPRRNAGTLVMAAGGGGAPPGGKCDGAANTTTTLVLTHNPTAEGCLLQHAAESSNARKGRVAKLMDSLQAYGIAGTESDQLQGCDTSRESLHRIYAIRTPGRYGFCLCTTSDSSTEASCTPTAVEDVPSRSRDDALPLGEGAAPPIIVEGPVGLNVTNLMYGDTALEASLPGIGGIVIQGGMFKAEVALLLLRKPRTSGEAQWEEVAAAQAAEETEVVWSGTPEMAGRNISLWFVHSPGGTAEDVACDSTNRTDIRADGSPAEFVKFNMSIPAGIYYLCYNLGDGQDIASMIHFEVSATFTAAEDMWNNIPWDEVPQGATADMKVIMQNSIGGAPPPDIVVLSDGEVQGYTLGKDINEKGMHIEFRDTIIWRRWNPVEPGKAPYARFGIKATANFINCTFVDEQVLRDGKGDPSGQAVMPMLQLWGGVFSFTSPTRLVGAEFDVRFRDPVASATVVYFGSSGAAIGSVVDVPLPEGSGVLPKDSDRRDAPALSKGGQSAVLPDFLFTSGAGVVMSDTATLRILPPLLLSDTTVVPPGLSGGASNLFSREPGGRTLSAKNAQIEIYYRWVWNGVSPPEVFTPSGLCNPDAWGTASVVLNASIAIESKGKLSVHPLPETGFEMPPPSSGVGVSPQAFLSGHLPVVDIFHLAHMGSGSVVGSPAGTTEAVRVRNSFFSESQVDISGSSGASVVLGAGKHVFSLPGTTLLSFGGESGLQVCSGVINMRENVTVVLRSLSEPLCVENCATDSFLGLSNSAVIMNSGTTFLSSRKANVSLDGGGFLLNSTGTSAVQAMVAILGPSIWNVTGFHLAQGLPSVVDLLSHLIPGSHGDTAGVWEAVESHYPGLSTPPPAEDAALELTFHREAHLVGIPVSVEGITHRIATAAWGGGGMANETVVSALAPVIRATFGSALRITGAPGDAGFAGDTCGGSALSVPFPLHVMSSVSLSGCVHLEDSSYFSTASQAVFQSEPGGTDSPAASVLLTGTHTAHCNVTWCRADDLECPRCQMVAGGSNVQSLRIAGGSLAMYGAFSISTALVDVESQGTLGVSGGSYITAGLAIRSGGALFTETIVVQGMVSIAGAVNVSIPQEEANRPGLDDMKCVPVLDVRGPVVFSEGASLSCTSRHKPKEDSWHFTALRWSQGNGSDTKNLPPFENCSTFVENPAYPGTNLIAVHTVRHVGAVRVLYVFDSIMDASSKQDPAIMCLFGAIGFFLMAPLLSQHRNVISLARNLRAPPPINVRLSWAESIWKVFGFSNLFGIAALAWEAWLLFCVAFHHDVPWPSYFKGFQRGAYPYFLLKNVKGEDFFAAFMVLFSAVVLWGLLWLPLMPGVVNFLKKDAGDMSMGTLPPSPPGSSTPTHYRGEAFSIAAFLKGSRDFWMALFFIHKTLCSVAYVGLLPVLVIFLAPLDCYRDVLQGMDEGEEWRLKESVMRAYDDVVCWSDDWRFFFFLVGGLAASSVMCLLAFESTSNRMTPFSHPPYRNHLDVRSKRTFEAVRTFIMAVQAVVLTAFYADVMTLIFCSFVLQMLYFGLVRFCAPCIHYNVNRLRMALQLVGISALAFAMTSLVANGEADEVTCEGIHSVVPYAFWAGNTVIFFGAIYFAFFKDCDDADLMTHDDLALARCMVLSMLSKHDPQEQPTRGDAPAPAPPLTLPVDAPAPPRSVGSPCDTTSTVQFPVSVNVLRQSKLPAASKTAVWVLLDPGSTLQHSHGSSPQPSVSASLVTPAQPREAKKAKGSFGTASNTLSSAPTGSGQHNGLTTSSPATPLTPGTLVPHRPPKEEDEEDSLTLRVDNSVAYLCLLQAVVRVKRSVLKRLLLQIDNLRVKQIRGPSHETRGSSRSHHHQHQHHQHLAAPRSSTHGDEEMAEICASASTSRAAPLGTPLSPGCSQAPNTPAAYPPPRGEALDPAHQGNASVALQASSSRAGPMPVGSRNHYTRAHTVGSSGANTSDTHYAQRALINWLKLEHRSELHSFRAWRERYTCEYYLGTEGSMRAVQAEVFQQAAVEIARSAEYLERLTNAGDIEACTRFDPFADSLLEAASSALKKQAEEERAQVQEMLLPEGDPDNDAASAHMFDGWVKGQMLGRGSYGSVYVAILKGGSLLAVKTIELPAEGTPDQAQLLGIQKEVGFIRDMKHPNVIQYKACFLDKQHNCINIFMEYAVGGSLTSLVKKCSSPLPERVVRVYIQQVLSGLAYLHMRNVIHRDIKGENVLLDSSGCVKLADFGCAKELSGTATRRTVAGTCVGSPYWMAPEVIQNKKYDHRCDIWSVGCTTVEVLNKGSPPWRDMDHVLAAMYHISRASGGPDNVPEGLSQECRNFLDLCFRRDWVNRPEAAELLTHEWIVSDVPEETPEETPVAFSPKSNFATPRPAPAAELDEEDIELFTEPPMTEGVFDPPEGTLTNCTGPPGPSPRSDFDVLSGDFSAPSMPFPGGGVVERRGSVASNVTAALSGVLSAVSPVFSSRSKGAGGLSDKPEELRLSGAIDTLSNIDDDDDDVDVRLYTDDGDSTPPHASDTGFRRRMPALHKDPCFPDEARISMQSLVFSDSGRADSAMP